MTVGVSWLRRGPEWNELWVATDSRLSGDGYEWDECPKIVPLPRNDALAAFSGTTEQAYPLLLQIRNAISAYNAARRGELEFFALVRHLERVINATLAEVSVDRFLHGSTHDVPFSKPGDVLLLAGYSRQAGDFAMRALQPRAGKGTPWVFAKVRERRETFGPNKPFRVFGDRYSVSAFVYHLSEFLKRCGKYGSSRPFDLEPLEVLWEFLKLPEASVNPPDPTQRTRTVGGAPQVARVLPGASVSPLAVRWEAYGRIDEFLFGRRCLPYERLDVGLIERVGTTMTLRAAGQWDRSFASESPVPGLLPAIRRLLRVISRR
jgi:hypothetical protein